jgi:hypothetical protein
VESLVPSHMLVVKVVNRSVVSVLLICLLIYILFVIFLPENSKSATTPLNHLNPTPTTANQKTHLTTLSIMALTPSPRLDILRYRSQLILPAVLVQQVLPVAVPHLGHVRSLGHVAGSVGARVAGGAAAGCHEAVGDGEADEDCEAGADDDEEGYEDAVEGGRLVGWGAGHWMGESVLVLVRCERRMEDGWLVDLLFGGGIGVRGRVKCR